MEREKIIEMKEEEREEKVFDHLANDMLEEGTPWWITKRNNSADLMDILLGK